MPKRHLTDPPPSFNGASNVARCLANTAGGLGANVFAAVNQNLAARYVEPTGPARGTRAGKPSMKAARPTGVRVGPPLCTRGSGRQRKGKGADPQARPNRLKRRHLP